MARVTFPAVGTGYMFSCAWHHSHTFHLDPGACFAVLGAGHMLSRAKHWLHASPSLAPVKYFSGWFIMTEKTVKKVPLNLVISPVRRQLCQGLLGVYNGNFTIFQYNMSECFLTAELLWLRRCCGK